MSCTNRAPIAGVAFAGVVVAHAFTYAMVAGPHGAPSLLARTGHGYWTAATGAALVVAGAGVLILIVKGFAGRWRSSVSEEPFRLIAMHLSALQFGLFCAIELGERLAAGVSLGSVLHQDVLWTGLAVQVLVATALAAFTRLLSRSAHAARACLSSKVAPTGEGASALTFAFAAPSSAFRAGGAGVRGPPIATS